MIGDVGGQVAVVSPPEREEAVLVGSDDEVNVFVENAAFFAAPPIAYLHDFRDGDIVVFGVDE